MNQGRKTNKNKFMNKSFKITDCFSELVIS